MFKKLRSRPKQEPQPQPANSGDKTATMDLMQHITELRKRLLIALAAMVVMTAIATIFGEKLIEILERPNGGVENLVSIEVTENIGVFMRVTLLAGFIASLPIILYELIAFVMPGLTPSERSE